MEQIPALRQSLVEQMSCPFSYGLVFIQGVKAPDSVASTRGTEVHSVLAQYVAHCAEKRIPADFAFLDALVSNVGEETAEIIETCRDSFTVDFDHLFACEVSMGLDENWEPTDSIDHDNQVVPIDLIWGYPGTGKYPMVSGILDTIYLLPNGKSAKIVDYKSHPRPFDPDTFQAKLYSLMLFMHLPDLEEVEFVLKFVRYANVAKPIKFLRSDVPQLMHDVERARNRQADLHTYYAQSALPALAGSHCTYCPALSDFSCPIAKLNPMANLDPTDRLNFRLWYDNANRVNNKAMQDFVDGTGLEITGKDGNGKSYTFGPVEKTKVTFPLFVEDGLGGFDAPIVDALSNWAFTNPEDLRPKKGGKPWFANLRIGSTQLKSYLKAKKREIIDNAIKDLATSETKVELRITRDAEVDDGEGEEHREYDSDEVHEFQA